MFHENYVLRYFFIFKHSYKSYYLLNLIQKPSFLNLTLFSNDNNKKKSKDKVSSDTIHGTNNSNYTQKLEI